ncbi:N-acetylmuramoyl-L-alanine amidase [Bacteroidia bacterium]|nr:N-acetylmuramoyl-L-alanine amidase [Bacteroidia bacterium]
MALIIAGGRVMAGPQLTRIVIDPGHGGTDVGAQGRFSDEKNITLSVALKLGNMIADNFKDVQVIYTRANDISLELWQRPQMANANKANLFLSIHCNSSEIDPRRALPSGFETYVMGLHRTEDNLAVAQKENAAILMEKNHDELYDGFDPRSPESYIIFANSQNKYLAQSLNYAASIQRCMGARVDYMDRGVKQAGFLVLRGATMPSVLTEIGFINNPEEERFMNSDEGQARIVTALFEAFREYKYAVDKTGDSTLNSAFAPNFTPINNMPTNVMPPSPTYDNHVGTEPTFREASAPSMVIFRVQFTSSSQAIPLNSTEFQHLSKVWRYVYKGAYRYTAGEAQTLQEANSILREVQKLGYEDAFVVAFLGDERITINEALRLQRK